MGSRRLKHERLDYDPETGNITKTERVYSIKVSPENFFMVFNDMLPLVLSITSIRDMRVLLYLSSIADFNTGKIEFSAAGRVEVCRILKIKTDALTNSIRGLRERGFISGERNTYQLNELIFWKGTTEARRKLIEGKKLNAILRPRN